jgi:hypothetical protein
MKQILFITGVGLALAASSCKVDKGKMLVNEWKMAEDSSVIFQLHADSSFSSHEGDVTLSGKWNLSPDGQWLTLHNNQDDKEEWQRRLEIKELSHERMILSNRGDSMIFIGSR